MKKIVLLTVILCGSLMLKAQLIKRIADRAKQKVEQKAGDKVDKGIDDTVDGKKKSGKQSSDQTADNTADADNSGGAGGTATDDEAKDDAANIKNYGKFDFVPGTKILFEDNLVHETDGEFPSLFNTTKGQVQVAEIKGEKVIQSFSCADLIPRIKGGEDGKDILPDQFTIECDVFFPKDWGTTGWWWLTIKFLDLSDKGYHEYSDGVPHELWIDQKTAKYENFTSDIPEELMHGGWNRISVAVNKNMLKVYLNQTRLINTPNFKGNPRSITLEPTPNGCDNRAVVMIKNIRIAEGGMDLYKRTTVEGKFIARGINFDYNKAILRPESMGEINRIYKLMNDNPSLKFEIGGHTDVDGDDAYNLKLSQQRADAVKDQLVKMGIDASRLTTKGYGETKPIGENDSPEGKANNRRVEFVKS